MQTSVSITVKNLFKSAEIKNYSKKIGSAIRN